MTSLTTKTALALGWHVVDVALDAGRAPRWARLAWAGVGIVWAGYFFSQLPGSPLLHPVQHKINPQWSLVNLAAAERKRSRGGIDG